MGFWSKRLIRFAIVVVIFANIAAGFLIARMGPFSSSSNIQTLSFPRTNRGNLYRLKDFEKWGSLIAIDSDNVMSIAKDGTYYVLKISIQLESRVLSGIVDPYKEEVLFKKAPYQYGENVLLGKLNGQKLLEWAKQTENALSKLSQSSGLPAQLVYNCRRRSAGEVIAARKMLVVPQLIRVQKSGKHRPCLTKMFSLVWAVKPDHLPAKKMQEIYGTEWKHRIDVSATRLGEELDTEPFVCSNWSDEVNKIWRVYWKKNVLSKVTRQAQNLQAKIVAETLLSGPDKVLQRGGSSRGVTVASLPSRAPRSSHPASGFSNPQTEKAKTSEGGLEDTSKNREPVKNRLPSDLGESRDASYAELTGLADGSRKAQQLQKQFVSKHGLPLEVRARESRILFRLVPAGEVDPAEPPNGRRGHIDGVLQETIELTGPLYCSKFEVTRDQWERVMNSETSLSKRTGGNTPMVQVTGNQCQEFCERLCRLEGVPQGSYRLLTEAEWEYACRAGTSTPFYFGTRLDATLANIRSKQRLVNKKRGTTERAVVTVGNYLPNAFGLYDMYGNAWEFCSHTPRKQNRIEYCVQGGSFDSVARQCIPTGGEASKNVATLPGSRGFRIVRQIAHSQ